MDPDSANVSFLYIAIPPPPPPVNTRQCQLQNYFLGEHGVLRLEKYQLRRKDRISIIFLKKTQNANDDLEIVSLNFKQCKGCLINILFCAIVLAGVMRRKSIYWQHLIQITAPTPVKYKNWTVIFILAFTLSL